MKKVDFGFFDEPDDDDDEPYDTDMSGVKDQWMRVALIEIEGKLPTIEERRKHCVAEKHPVTGEWIVMWKGKAILWFSKVTVDDDGIPNINCKFLYE